jgi:hypothetical protein
MHLHAYRQIFCQYRNIVLAIGGVTKYWLQPFVRHEDGCIGACEYPQMYSGVIRDERQKSLKLLLVNPRKANITHTLRNLNMKNSISTITNRKCNSLGTHSCAVPFSRLLAVLFAATAIGIAESKFLLSVGVAQPRRNFEIRLKETKIVGDVGALFQLKHHKHMYE